MAKNKDKVLSYLQENKICVLATADKKGKTEAATVVYAFDNKLNIYIGTSKASRKYKNLLQNKKVSIVVGVDLNDSRTLQIDGNAKILDRKAARAASKLMLGRYPSLAEVFKGTAFIAVKPTFVMMYENLSEERGGKGVYFRVI